MIHRILGPQNCGKTSALALFAFNAFRSGKVVYTNTPFNFPHILINKDFVIQAAREDMGIKNAFFALDEYWIWIDARNPMSEANKVSSYFTLQSSKLDIDIFTTAQTDSQDDKRLRENAHFVSECSRVIMDADGQIKNVISENRILNPDITADLYIRIKTFKLGLYGYKKFTEYMVRASKIIGLYDTRKRIYYMEKN